LELRTFYHRHMDDARALSGVLAIGLHMIALVFLGSSPESPVKRHVAPPATASLAWVKVSMLDKPVDLRAPAAPASKSPGSFSKKINTPTKALHIPVLQTKPYDPEPILAEPAVIESASAGSRPQSPHYYAFSEVDVPAQPESDWGLDAATLEQLAITQLVFEVWINELGQVVQLTVVQPQDLPPQGLQILTTKVLQSVVLPALRVGKPVASRRRIELSVESMALILKAEPTPGPVL
jgi:hypothetical protein